MGKGQITMPLLGTAREAREEPEAAVRVVPECHVAMSLSSLTQITPF